MILEAGKRRKEKGANKSGFKCIAVVNRAQQSVAECGRAEQRAEQNREQNRTEPVMASRSTPSEPRYTNRRADGLPLPPNFASKESCDVMPDSGVCVCVRV